MNICRFPLALQLQRFALVPPEISCNLNLTTRVLHNELAGLRLQSPLYSIRLTQITTLERKTNEFNGD